MDATLTPIVILLAIIIFFAGLYLIGRALIPEAAERDIFFSSPKLGRIKARKRSGRIICFIDNIVGKNKQVNSMTGRIESGERRPTGLWWTLFGVHFIGMDDVYTYKIAIEAVEDETGQLRYVEKDASSIFLEGSYSLSAKFVTRDGVRIRIKLQLALSTLDAAKALSLPISWTIPVFTAVLGASRDFIGSRDVRTLISVYNEGQNIIINDGPSKNSDFITHILNLNNPTPGNVPLEDICGQKITAVNIVELDFADEKTKDAFSILFMAEQEALAMTRKGDVEAVVFSKKAMALGQINQPAADVLTAEQQKSMPNLRTLVNVKGGGNSVLSLPTDDK